MDGEIEHSKLSVRWKLPSRSYAQVERIDEMVSSTEANEPGTAAYEWYVDSGNTRFHVFERYRDSRAAMIHLRTFDQMFVARLGRLLQIERVTLFGNASEEVLNTLGHEGTLVLLPLAGFTR